MRNSAPIYCLIGNRICHYRQLAGLSQQALAAKTGYGSRAAISLIEAGGTQIKAHKIQAFASALNIHPALLLSPLYDLKEDAPKPPPYEALYDALARLTATRTVATGGMGSPRVVDEILDIATQLMAELVTARKTLTGCKTAFEELNLGLTAATIEKVLVETNPYVKPTERKRHATSISVPDSSEKAE
ncbi:MAG: helix-turn-helix transcriptional regulator [Sterolibacterium sp.]